MAEGATPHGAPSAAPKAAHGRGSWMEDFKRIPGWAWIGMALAVGAFIIYRAHRTTNAGTVVSPAATQTPIDTTSPTTSGDTTSSTNLDSGLQAAVSQQGQQLSDLMNSFAAAYQQDSQFQQATAQGFQQIAQNEQQQAQQFQTGLQALSSTFAQSEQGLAAALEQSQSQLASAFQAGFQQENQAMQQQDLSFQQALQNLANSQNQTNATVESQMSALQSLIQSASKQAFSLPAITINMPATNAEPGVTGITDTTGAFLASMPTPTVGPEPGTVDKLPVEGYEKLPPPSGIGTVGPTGTSGKSGDSGGPSGTKLPGRKVME